MKAYLTPAVQPPLASASDSARADVRASSSAALPSAPRPSFSRAETAYRAVDGASHRPARTQAPPSYLAVPIAELLGRGGDRALSVIQTLVRSGSTSALQAALRAQPHVIDRNTLVALASCDARREFRLGLTLRHDLADDALLTALAATDARPLYRSAVESLRSRTRG